MLNKKILLLSTYNEYATGCRQLAAVLLNAGYSVKIVVFKKYNTDVSKSFYTQTEEKLLTDYIKSYCPDIIAFSCISDIKLSEDILFEILKKAAPQALLACGGFGPTLEPERFLKAGAAYVLRGEGEESILEFVALSHSKEDLKKINNLSYLDENNKLVDNPLRPLIEDIDTILPFYHGDEHFVFIENDELFEKDYMFSIQKVYLLLASRGCTSNCSYCCAGNWINLYRKHYTNVKRYRIRSSDSLIKELIQAKEMGVGWIMFYDEYFLRTQEEFENFFVRYKEEINLPYSLSVHTKHLIRSKEDCDLVTSSGLAVIEVGVQSANKHISKNVFNRKTDPKEQFKAIINLYERRVSTRVNFITAHALEGEEEYHESLEFVKNLPFDASWQRRIYLHNFKLGLSPGAPIKDMFPILQEKPVSNKEGIFKTLMLNVRHVVKDDSIFYSMYNDHFFKDNPLDIYDMLLPQLYLQAQYDYWAKAIKDLAGKEVYFWGCGNWYHTQKHLFRHCKPKAMLINVPTKLKDIDGIEILNPDEILHSSSPLPIIFFGAHSHRTSQYCHHTFPNFTQLYTHAPLMTVFDDLRRPTLT